MSPVAEFNSASDVKGEKSIAVSRNLWQAEGKSKAFLCILPNAGVVECRQVEYSVVWGR